MITLKPLILLIHGINFIKNSLGRINMFNKNEKYEDGMREFYDDLATQWDGRFGKTKSSKYFFNKRLRKIKRCLGSDFNSIMEIGCGTGYHLMRLMKPEHKGMGIDISKKMLQIAKKNQKQYFPNLNLKFKIDNGENLKLSDNTFDRVIFVGYLNHIQKRHKALTEIRRVLRTGGRLVGLVPNRWCPWYSLRLRKVFANDFGALSRDIEFSPSQIKSMMKKAGFKNVKIYIFNSIPGKVPNLLFYPMLFVNSLFGVWPISLLGGHIIISGEK